MTRVSVSLTRRVAWSVGLWAVVALLLYATFATVQYNWNWPRAWAYRQQFLFGWLTTLGVSGCAMLVSIGVGFTLMLGRRSPWLPVEVFCSGVVQILRGSPLLVQLLVGYYIIATAVRVSSPLFVGTLLLGCFHGTYLAEVFRGAVESIGASQREAARAVGFDSSQTYRYVIIPQAIRRAVPATTGQLVSLIKDSSLLSVIGIDELFLKVKVLAAGTYTALEGYSAMAAAYLVVTLPLSWFAKRLERKFAYET